MKTKLCIFAIVITSVSVVIAQSPSAPSNLRILTGSVSNPPPSEPTIWGVVDPSILGTCTAAVHDQYTIDGGDGFRYRTWHAQVDPSGCVFGHEHGDNPNRMQNAEIASQPVLFGYVGRRMIMADMPNGHEEAHEGFKIFIANPGERNDEGRVNRVYSRSVFHMGTGGPKRFTMQFHSADIRLIHPEFGLKAFTRLMMDTGTTHTVCDPRFPSPTKDAMSLASPCILDSQYEIWSTTQRVRYQGKAVYQAFATPAVFDPITVFNPANPTEVVYNWDARVNAIMHWPNNSRSGNRGCDRESYAQPGYWWNGKTGRTVFYTDTLGNELPSNDPLALAQTVSQSESVGAPATNDGLLQYKVRRSWCQNSGQLGLKN